MFTAIVVLALLTSACASDSAQGNEGFCEGIPADVPQAMQAPGSVWLNPPLDTVTTVTDWFASLPVSPDQQIQAGIDKLILDLEAAATGVSGPTETLSVSTGGITSLINEVCGLNIGSVRMTFGT